MLKEVVEKYPSDQVSVFVVWLPMVPGDSKRAARSTGAMYAGYQVRQYYDPDRTVGLAYHREVFPNCLRDALSVMPKDHSLYGELSGWAASSRGDGPLWDAVLVYPSGAEWNESIPRPTSWSKQAAFFGISAGEITAVFFRNDCMQPPTESDWHIEVKTAMNALLGERPSSAMATPRIELLGFRGCPHTPTIRKNLEAALASLGGQAKITDVNLETLTEKDARRGWGAPTILVDGRDLMGLTHPAGRTLSCRVYSDGLPSKDEIFRRLINQHALPAPQAHGP